MIVNRYYIFIAGLIVIGVIGAHWYASTAVARALDTTRLTLVAQIAEQEVVLQNVADLTRQGEADEVTKRIVVDCSSTERDRFETLLNRLSAAINNTELRELDSLFFKCARFFADRKSVMATRLVRETDVYRDRINLYNRVVPGSETLDNKVVLWQQIAEDELELATLYNQLVELQRDIILALLAGKDRTSDDINKTLEAVNQTRSAMIVLTQQVENARTLLREL